MAFPGDENIILTPAPYLFKLVSPLGNVSLTHEPLEWGECVYTIERNLETYGITEKLSVDKLTFIKEGAKLLTDLFELYEANAKCDLYIYRFKRSTNTYVQLPSTFSAVFSSYKTTKIINVGIGVEVSFIETGAKVDFENRRKIEIDILRIKETIGGVVPRWLISPFQSSDSIKLPDNIYNVFIGVWALPLTQPGYETDNATSGDDTYTAIPITLQQSDFSEAVTTVNYVTKKTNIADIEPFFNASTEDRTVDIIWYIRVNVTDDAPRKSPYSLRIISEKDGIFSSTVIKSWGGDTGNFIFDGTYANYKIEAGATLRMVVKVESRGRIDAQVERFAMIIQQSAGTITPYTGLVDGIRIDIALNILCKLLLDDKVTFDSDYFEATNQETLLHLCTGRTLRGVELDSDGLNFPVSFDKLFKTLHAIYNIGYDLRNLILKIEDFDYFFQDSEIIDISNRISIYDVLKEYLPDLAFSSVKIGFENYTYNKVNGRSEYNTKQERTTVINTDQQLDLMSPYRADVQGIIDLLNNPATFNDSTDIEGDEDVFLLKTRYTPGVSFFVNYSLETNQQVTVNNNSSILGIASFNLMFTPLRSLLRHGKRIKASLTKYLNTKLAYQSGTKNQTLDTTENGVRIVENQDVLINDLDDPAFVPIKLITESYATWDDIDEISSNPYGFVTLPSSEKGFVLKVSKKINENKATFELLKKYEPS